MIADSDVTAIQINTSASQAERVVFAVMLLVGAIESEQLTRVELTNALLDIRSALSFHAPDQIGILR